MSVSNRASFGMDSMDDCGVNYCADEIAVAPEVESKEVGDFCVFTAKEPITLLARKSAVVPMFTVDLKHAGIVLLYKESNHASRPYRAVKFKNETEYSLGRGKTVIYNEGVFSGECVLDTAKPGGTGLGLPTCRRIFEEHDGQIELISELGKGSDFRILLPLKENNN